MQDLLDALRAYDALRDQPDNPGRDRVCIRSTPAQAPPLDDSRLLDELPPKIRSAIESSGVTQLYAHQAEAIRAALKGHNVVLEAPTASGKTIAFVVPMLQRLLDDRQAHALLIHPMKALSNDQRRQIEAITSGIPRGPHRPFSWTLDGDTPPDHRKLLKDDPPAILLTNPDMVHQSILGWSQHWERLLKGIRYIIIDEIHEYRGYFGTNVALLIRRLLAKLAALGHRHAPQLFLATATCANAKEHAERLTGQPFVHCRASGNMAPPRHFAFINPVGIPDYEFIKVYQHRIARAALACYSRGLSTIVFCPSRKFTEEVVKRARREAPKYALDPGRVAPYRSGYTEDERRDIEDGMRDGRFMVVFSTNALELGVDIGRLDVCILAGFPDSIMSAWQRIGRVGRDFTKDAYVLFYAMNNPTDAFYAENLDAFLNRPLENVTVGLENEEIIDRHIPYLLHEVPAMWDIAVGPEARQDGRLRPQLQTALGQTFIERVRTATQGVQRPTSPSRVPSYQRLNLRGNTGPTMHLIHGNTEIGTVSDLQAFREAYVGAVYSHLGRSYRVVAHRAHEVLLEAAPADHHTVPHIYSVANEADFLQGFRYGQAVSVFYGRLTIFENFTSYDLLDGDDTVIEQVTVNLAKQHKSHAFWLVLEQARDVGLESIRALGYMMDIGLGFCIPCDRHDTAVLPDTKTPPRIYLYETVPGGIGIAQKALDVWRCILQQGMSIAEACTCKDGCPRCVLPARARAKEEVSKSQGLVLAQRLLDGTPDSPTHRLDLRTGGWRTT